MEQLIATPVRPVELVTGKLIPYIVIGFGDTVLCVLISALVLGVPLRGSILLLFSSSLIFLVGGLSFGVLISTGAKNQLLASQLGMLTSFLPSFLLSGFIFSISNMPASLRVITYAVPARYFVSILKGVSLKGTGLAYLAPEVSLLALYGAVVFALACRKLKKRIE
jgi:ABC-2 type transport system permease protein